jgi:hypothetical protein
MLILDSWKISLREEYGNQWDADLFPRARQNGSPCSFQKRLKLRFVPKNDKNDDHPTILVLLRKVVITHIVFWFPPYLSLDQPHFRDQDVPKDESESCQTWIHWRSQQGRQNYGDHLGCMSSAQHRCDKDGHRISLGWSNFLSFACNFPDFSSRSNSAQIRYKWVGLFWGSIESPSLGVSTMRWWCSKCNWSNWFHRTNNG